MDQILFNGDSTLFGASNEQCPLTDSVPDSFETNGLHVAFYILESCTGLLENTENSVAYYSIESFLARMDKYAFLAIGFNTPSYSSAIFRHNNNNEYSMFDLHSRSAK